MDASLELQAAIVAAVQADAPLMALITGIYDRVQRGADGLPVPTVWGAQQGYISLGPEDVLADEAGCVGIDSVSIQLDIWSRKPGRVHCKQIIGELRRVMAGVATDENPIVSRADPVQQIMRDPDGLTMHGVLRYEFGMERHG